VQFCKWNCTFDCHPDHSFFKIPQKPAAVIRLCKALRRFTGRERTSQALLPILGACLVKAQGELNARGNGMSFDWLLHVLAVAAVSVCAGVIWIVARQELSA
jgi:hypothetical protein